jgi:hypothetical protein
VVAIAVTMVVAVAETPHATIVTNLVICLAMTPQDRIEVEAAVARIDICHNTVLAEVAAVVGLMETAVLINHIAIITIRLATSLEIPVRLGGLLENHPLMDWPKRRRNASNN